MVRWALHKKPELPKNCLAENREIMAAQKVLNLILLLEHRKSFLSRALLNYLPEPSGIVRVGRS